MLCDSFTIIDNIGFNPELGLADLEAANISVCTQ